MKITINNPIHTNYVGISQANINKALRLGEPLEINIPHLGTGKSDPKEWMKTGRMFKKVYLFPDNPMTMYANYVPIVDTRQLTIC